MPSSSKVRNSVLPLLAPAISGIFLLAGPLCSMIWSKSFASKMDFHHFLHKHFEKVEFFFSVSQEVPFRKLMNLLTQTGPTGSDCFTRGDPCKSNHPFARWGCWIGGGCGSGVVVVVALCVVACGVWWLLLLMMLLLCLLLYGVSCRLMQMVYLRTSHLFKQQTLLLKRKWMTCATQPPKLTVKPCQMRRNISFNKDRFSPVATLPLWPLLVGLSACCNGLLRDRFEKSAGKPTSLSLSSCFFWGKRGKGATMSRPHDMLDIVGRLQKARKQPLLKAWMLWLTDLPFFV